MKTTKGLSNYLLLFLTVLPIFATAQSSILVRNNTWLDFEVRVEQSGSHLLDPAEWDQKETVLHPWFFATELMETNRDAAAIPMGDSVFFEVQLIAAPDTLRLKFRLDGVAGGSELDYSLSGPGFSDAWFDNGGFHQANASFGGRDVIIKYTPENGDGNQSRDLLFQVHETPLYSLDSTDFADPNVINVLAYNMQMLPFGISGMGQANDRARYFPQWLSPWQDVVIFEEAFDDNARENRLEPAMATAGFPYKTDILNDYLPFNGGVIIFSRWPIETTDMYDFALCGPNSADCFANKGILYARINKLGKKYHVLGTHMDAGSAPADLEAKNLQMAEMREMIADQEIPEWEAVVYGGDFNVGPTGGHNLYANMHDSLDPIVIPHHIGFWESTFDTDTAHIIDHVWGCGSHLVPMVATNDIITPRPLEDDLWELGEFSDHRAVQGRFVYPDLQAQGTDTSLCPGDTYTMSVSASNSVTYQWYKDGQTLAGETTSSLTLSNAQAADSGAYACEISYTEIFGTETDFVTPYFFPNGPDTLDADIMMDLGVVDVNCSVGQSEEVSGIQRLSVFPNPTGQGTQMQVECRLMAAAELTLEIIDLHGRLLHTQIVQTSAGTSLFSLECDELQAGLYGLRVTSTNGSAYRKLVIY